MAESDDRVRRAIDAIRVHVRSESDFGSDAIERAAPRPAPMASTATVVAASPETTITNEPTAPLAPSRVPAPSNEPVATSSAPARPAVDARSPAFVPRVAPLGARLGSAEARAELDRLEADVAACTLCKLHATRTCTVPGEGNASPDLLFIGEGPGEEEDRSGRPFVGRAGELLTKIIGAMGFSRETVHIANIVKCRPPGNRVPEPDEIAACQPYLMRQIVLLKPKLICTLGLPATRTILGITQGIKAVRGREFVWTDIPVIPTFHPAYLLRNPDDKPLVWQDAQTIVRRLVQLGASIPNPDALKKFKDPPPEPSA
ncbi:MAG: uracil-DNA glycosylase [Planctomycetes bacterium]|nr:uracil-DNA glycosylase [Planctomycetota bacterium]